MINSAQDVERLFLKCMANYSKEDRTNELHLTDLVSDCLRRVWFEKHMPSENDIENILRMWQGSVLHTMPLLSSHELSLELEGVKSRIDEYGDGVLIEKKFVMFVPKDEVELRKYYSHYIKQVQFEALFLQQNGNDVKSAYLLFVRRGEAEEGKPAIRAFNVPLDWESIAQDFISTVEVYNLTLQQNTPPAIPLTYTPFDYPCTYCNYRTKCWVEAP
jgi:hypothetical protein